MAELVRLGLGAEVEPAFARACHEVTGGVPFLVQELVRTIAEEGIEPTAAAASRVAALAPRAVSQSVVQRLSRLSSAAGELARAAAVLGEADLRLAAGLADVDPAPPQPPPTSWPQPGSSSRVGRCASCTRSSGRRSRQISPAASAPALHAAAARRLASEGASADRIAAHLLATDPAGDDWVVESLLAAARTAIANGAPDSAVAYLRRALAEPPSERLRPDVLLELGFAESYAGDPQASAHLEAALDAAADASLRSRSRSRWDGCSRSRAASARRWRCSTERAPASAAPTDARR